MRFSTALTFVSSAIIVGAAAYAFCKYYKIANKNATIREKNKTCHNASSSNTDFNINQSGETSNRDVVLNFEKTQHEIIGSIKDRHSMAAQEMRDTLNEIVNDDLEFEKTINKVNNELDDLMK